MFPKMDLGFHEIPFMAPLMFPKIALWFHEIPLIALSLP